MGTFDGGSVPPGDAAWGRELYGVEPGHFAAVIVGEDGTDKHRSGEPVEPEDLYTLVDETPGRGREMRERGG